MRTPKDPITAFRGAGHGRYSVEKLIKDRRMEREDEARDKQSASYQKRDLRELKGKIGFWKNYDHKALRRRG